MTCKCEYICDAYCLCELAGMENPLFPEVNNLPEDYECLGTCVLCRKFGGVKKELN
jgi:hypothetical protein